MGFPVSTSIKVPARTFSKVQTSTAHAVEEWTPCCHRLLTEFVNLQVLNTVEVPDNQRLSFYDYFLFSFCFLFLILKGLCYIFFIIRPVVALAHHGLQRLLCTLRWILVFLEQSLHHHSHLCPCRFLPVPVDGAVAVQHLRQFLGQRHKLLV